MRRIVLVTLLATVGACTSRPGGDAVAPSRSPPGEPLAAPAPPVAEAAAAVEPPPRERECAAIGFAAVPEPPPDEARRINREALEAHEAGRYEDSLCGFAEAVRLAPGFAMARYNLACALARLGRAEEARAALERLLCEDLPSFAPRLGGDPDLASLSDDAALRARVGALAERYREAGRRGAALVAHGRTRDGIWSQAGVWLADGARFAPMAPRVTESGSFAIAATMFVPAEGRALAVTGRGNDVEGDVGLAGTRVRTFRAPLGEPEVDRGRFAELINIRIGLVPGGARLHAASWEGGTWRTYRWDLVGSELRRTTAPLPGEVLLIRQASWVPFETDARYQVARGRLLLPDGREVDLGSPHPSYGSPWGSRVLADEAAGVAVVVSAAWGDCGVRDRHVLDRVDLRTGAVDRLLLGEGQVIVDIGQDGALYVQISRFGRTETRRYGDLRATSWQILPRGFALSSTPHDGNPYC